MSITRINQFEAIDGKADELHAFLQSIIAIILDCPGCLSCRLLRGAENPACLAIIEEWDSIQSHQQAAVRIPPALFTQAVSLFAKPPVGLYYQG